MRVTKFTKDTLRIRRGIKRLQSEGYERVGERGGNLWELHRGYRVGYVITDVKICPTGTALWIKTSHKLNQDILQKYQVNNEPSNAVC